MKWYWLENFRTISLAIKTTEIHIIKTTKLAVTFLSTIALKVNNNKNIESEND